MTTLLHASLTDRFIEIKNNFRRKKLHTMNQDSSFFGGSFYNGDNVMGAPSLSVSNLCLETKNSQFESGC